MIPNGYAATDRSSRLAKAQKIEALIGCNVTGLALLDLGAGSGMLADYFRSRGASVTAADRDGSAYRSDIPLVQITGKDLPFSDEQFDIVVFNHVIEHVGKESEQLAILSEVRRVLKPGGRLYLAAPNKWALIEPHLRLPLLGALPRRIANWMASRFRGAPIYDCFPLTRARMSAMAGTYFSAVEDKSTDAIAWVIEHEMDGFAKTALGAVPAALYRLAWPAYPTFIMLARK